MNGIALRPGRYIPRKKVRHSQSEDLPGEVCTTLIDPLKVPGCVHPRYLPAKAKLMSAENPTDIIVEAPYVNGIRQFARAATRRLQRRSTGHRESDIWRVGIAVHLDAQLRPTRQILVFKDDGVCSIHRRAKCIHDVRPKQKCVSQSQCVLRRLLRLDI